MRLGAKFIVALVTLTAIAQTSASALPYDPSVVRQLRQQRVRRLKLRVLNVQSILQPLPSICRAQ